jgi:hypothetical protein
MSFEALESALRAGWSGNDPLSNLGLFGMGYNIATARLGLVTEVWTSRAGDPEEVGVRIDLDEQKRFTALTARQLSKPFEAGSTRVSCSRKQSKNDAKASCTS